MIARKKYSHENSVFKALRDIKLKLPLELLALKQTNFTSREEQRAIKNINSANRTEKKCL
jgi:hypothetical protein